MLEWNFMNDTYKHVGFTTVTKTILNTNVIARKDVKNEHSEHGFTFMLE